MCFGGGGSTQPRVQKYQSKNDAAVITGMQIGVENPKDTKKASDELKIKRQKEEGTYKDPRVQSDNDLTTSSLLGSSRSNKSRNRKAANRDKAQHNFNKRKFSRGITGRKSGVA